MNKCVTLLFAAFLAGCGSGGDLDAIKNAKVGDHDHTWEEATKNFSYCQTDSKSWQLIEENREDRALAMFSCNLASDAIAEYNTQLAEDAARRARRFGYEEPAKAVSARLEVRISRWKTEQRKKAHKEFESSAHVYLHFDNNTERKHSYTSFDDIISANQNPLHGQGW